MDVGQIVRWQVPLMNTRKKERKKNRPHRLMHKNVGLLAIDNVDDMHFHGLVKSIA